MAFNKIMVMTYEEVLKILAHCAREEDCADCPWIGENNCAGVMAAGALAMIADLGAGLKRAAELLADTNRTDACDMMSCECVDGCPGAGPTADCWIKYLMRGEEDGDRH